MRIAFLIIIIIFCVNGVIFAQSNQNTPSERKPKDLQVDTDEGIVHPSILSDCDLSELPLDKRPQLTLQKAIAFAENYILQKKIVISDYYLLLAKPNPYKSEGWLLRWTKVYKESATEYIEIVISMEGKASQIKPR